MTEIKKKCTKCKRFYDYALFYFCRGRYRSECKKCTIRINVRYQKAKKRNITPDRSYMREYYATHKTQFAEYRRRFKEKHPGYYRDYKINKINK